ncbi:MAG: CBS domain-containing protein [Betaproteobacteria bacterium]|nr:CBS domain-containing protein [Betaproteobacteria bacterium]
MLIREILASKDSARIFSILPGATVAEAVKLMVQNTIGSLVVMENEVMVGYITERDVIRGMATKGCSLADVSVSEVMDKEPFVGSPEDSVDYARDVMTKNSISHLVVMDGDKLVGVISLHDIAKASLKYAHYENELLKRYIKHWPE